MRFFESKDKSGRTIYLTKERWSHINKEHPEVSGYFKTFEDVLNNPTKVVNYSHDKNIQCYYKHIKERKSYLLVIVKYLNGEGFIVTSYFVRNIQ